MAVDLEALRDLRLLRRQAVTPRDTMLYALGVGAGGEGSDERELAFVFERGLRAIPAMAITLCYADMIAAYTSVGLTAHKVLHGEQAFQLARPLPAEGEFEGETVVVGLADKGPGKGLLVRVRTEVREAASGELIATLDSSSLCMADGGCGGIREGETALIASHAIPDVAALAVVDTPTLRQQGLIYRLSGDYNALHVLPSLAHAAGHARPILHGRCTFGIVARVLLQEVFGHDSTRMGAMSARFTAPVYPGETLRTEIWPWDGGALFRARVVERDIVVLDKGWVSPPWRIPGNVVNSRS